jgi:hypothetical protein
MKRHLPFALILLAATSAFAALPTVPGTNEVDAWKKSEPANFAWSTKMGDLMLLQNKLQAEHIHSSQPTSDLGTFSFSIGTSDFTRARMIATNVISRNSLTIDVISEIHGWGYEIWKNGKKVGEENF